MDINNTFVNVLGMCEHCQLQDICKYKDEKTKLDNEIMVRDNTQNEPYYLTLKCDKFMAEVQYTNRRDLK